MKNNYRKINSLSSRLALTLVELLIAMFILQIVIMPIYLVFFGSRTAMAAARKISIASGLASSMVAAIREIKPEQLQQHPRCLDGKLKAPYSIPQLDIATAPKGFSRFLEVARADKLGKEGGPFFLVEVAVYWKNQKTSKKVEYKTRDLVRGVTK